MKDTKTRIDEAINRLRTPNKPHSDGAAQRYEPASTTRLLQDAFAKTRFSYGTTGSNTIRTGNDLKDSGSSTVMKTLVRLNMNMKKRKMRNSYRADRFDQNPSLLRNQALEALDKDIYNPGTCVNTMAGDGYQVIDMYYGVHNDHNDHIWQNRNRTIAELIHYAMEFHRPHTPSTSKSVGDDRLGGGGELAFDPNKPGWLAFREAFPTSGQPGYREQRVTTKVYGQSATKEISKIIRECVRRFGGTIVFDLKRVHGQGVFGPGTARCLDDADLELQDILNSHKGQITSSVIPFGNGWVEFQWGGRPVVPTRAHFLVNWNWSGALTSATFNRQGEPGRNYGWIDYLDAVMTDNHMHGLSHNWDKLEDFPRGIVAATTPEGKIAAIDALATLLSGTSTTRHLAA